METFIRLTAISTAGDRVVNVQPRAFHVSSVMPSGAWPDQLKLEDYYADQCTCELYPYNQGWCWVLIIIFRHGPKQALSAFV